MQPLKNDIMIFVRKQMQMKIIIIGKISQTPKDKFHMVSLIHGI